MKFSSLALALASTAYAQSNDSLVQALQSQPNLSSLLGLLNNSMVNAAALSSLSNVTFLAPDNNAIAAFENSSAVGQVAADPGLLQAILSYHVIQGNYSNITNTSFLATSLMNATYANVTGGQRVEALVGGSNVTFFSGLLQNSSVVNSSIPFSGGTIHVINRLLTLPQNISASAVALNLTAAAGALQTLNLTETVDTTPNLTVFLPDNAAFERIGGNLANLSTTNLTSILEYHVVQGLYYSTDLANTSVPSLQGNNLTITLEGNSVYVNNAKVLVPNVLVANGVVHVIDRVLNPNNATVSIVTSTTADDFASATSASGVPFTSGVPTPSTTIATAQVTSALSSAASASSSSSKGGAARPIETGAIGMAALFGGAAAVMNM